MSFIQKLLLGGIALVLAKGSSASFYKRESDASFSLYTYGAFSGSGARVFFADGKAYVGTGTPPGASEAFNITFTFDSATAQVSIEPDNTTTSWTETTRMFINTASDATDQVAFTTNSSLGSDNTATGFGLYGAWLFHEQEQNALDMNFFVVATEDEDIYALKWNGAGSEAPTGVSVAVRTEAPAAKVKKDI